MLGVTIMLTVFFACIFSALALAIYRGRIPLTSGRLTASLFGRLLGWGYPLLLLAALAAYYGLPFEQLYRAEEPLVDYTANTTHAADLNASVRQLLLSDETAAWANDELFQEQAVLPYADPALDLRVPTTAYLLVSGHPAADDTVILHYFPGQLNIAGYQADALIAPQLADFSLDGQGHLTVKGFESDQLEMQNLSFILWETGSPMNQFQLDTFTGYRHFWNSCDAALVVQVPADTTVTYYGDPVTKGQII